MGHRSVSSGPISAPNEKKESTLLSAKERPLISPSGGESTARPTRTADSKPGPLRTDLDGVIYDIG